MAEKKQTIPAINISPITNTGEMSFPWYFYLKSLGEKSKSGGSDILFFDFIIRDGHLIYRYEGSVPPVFKIDKNGHLIYSLDEGEADNG